MNVFPEDYTDHNLPLILLSGLEPQATKDDGRTPSSTKVLQEGGFRVKIDLPPVQSDLADGLLQAILVHDASKAPWNATPTTTKDTGGAVKIRSIGRVYSLPPRKAPPPPHSPWTRSGQDAGSPPVPLVLHSPLSPLTPSSPLYPDGLVTPLWIAKHQARLPAVFIMFFGLNSDANTSSLLDNKLKSEISNVKNVLSTTNYKTKLVVVLLGEAAISSQELEERLGLIRRSTTLDAKGLYFLPFGSSQVEVSEFVRNMLSSLQPVCVEYYRDLSKHARRKRNRSVVPQPTVLPGTGAGQALSSQGWNVRYEFKLAVFAEFRQEMDAACRNYETAYESLFAPEVLGSIAVSSPRFNDARMLSDIVALRIIRCQLWAGQSTAAVRTWTTHRNKTKNLMDEKGPGPDNLGWEAWQSTWSKTMAYLISRVDFATVNRKKPESPINLAVFAPPDRSLPLGERVAPWEQLHHEGYWLCIAERHAQNLRSQTQNATGDQDRASYARRAPGDGKQPLSYEAYLESKRHEDLSSGVLTGRDDSTDITTTLMAAATKFSAMNQLRTVEHLQLKQATEHMLDNAWAQAAALLQPLWKAPTYRKAGWLELLQEIGWALLRCAKQLQDVETLLRLEWELLNKVFTSKEGHTYDLHRVIAEPLTKQPRPAVALLAEEVASAIAPSFTFASAEGNAGEPLQAQIALHSHLQSNAKTIRLSEVKVVFEGSLRPVHIVMAGPEHSDEGIGPTVLIDLPLKDSTSMPERRNKRSSAGAIASFVGFTDLSIGPSQTRVFNLTLTPREAGDVKIASITMIIDDPNFSFTLIASELNTGKQVWWDRKGSTPISRCIGMERDATNIKILPKPPKLSILTPFLKPAYYTNETITLRLDFVNDEEEPVSGSMNARLVSPLQGAADVRWADEKPTEPEERQDATEGWIILRRRELGSLAPSARATLEALIFDTIEAVDHELEIVLNYYLESDPETLLMKTAVVEIPIIRPFEANYEFHPRLDPQPWPSFFKAPEISEHPKPGGLKQVFEVFSSVYSFASEDLFIDSTALRVQDVTGEAACEVSNGVLRDISRPDIHENRVAHSTTPIKPDETQSFSFDMSLQKMILGDRKMASVDLALDINWRRTDSQKINTSTLEIPRFVAPMAEPRVLLTIDHIPKSTIPGLCHLTYTIENPSMHFLTFNLSMESSDQFAFSGPKASAVSLVPISRHGVKYRILSSKQGEWVKVNLAVVDTYFGKTLKIQPGAARVKADKKGDVFVLVT